MKYRLETRQDYFYGIGICQYFAIVFSDTNKLVYTNKNIRKIVAFCMLQGLTDELEFANGKIEQLFKTNSK